VLNHWLTNSRNNVTFIQLIRHLFAPGLKRRARSRIEGIEKTEGFLKVCLQGFETPLYWPEEMDLRSLQMIITEVFDSSDWHHYEIEETSVEADDTVVDCGAAEGLFSLVHLEKCQKIYIVEPLPRFNEALELTFSGQSNIEIFPFALSSTEGFAEISSDGLRTTIKSTDNDTGIQISTLDKLFFETNIPVSFIKADLEGYDFEMIKGAENLIAANLPKIAITTYHHKDHSTLISRHLKKIHSGYKTRLKGIYALDGSPVLMHAWVEKDSG